MPAKIAVLILFLLAAAGGGTWWLVTQNPAPEPAAVTQPEAEAPAEPVAPAPAEEPVVAEAPVEPAAPAPTEEPAVAEAPAEPAAPAPAEEPVVAEAPAEPVAPAPTEEPAVAEAPIEPTAPASTEEPVVAEAPVEPAAPAPAEEPAVAEAPVEPAAPAPAEEPAVAEAPVEPAAPAPAEEPAVAEAPAEPAAPAPTEEPVVAEAPVAPAAPASTDEPAVAEAPVEPAAPAPTEEPVVAEAPVEPAAPAPTEEPAVAVAPQDLNTLEGLSALVDSFQITEEDTQAAFGDGSQLSSNGKASASGLDQLDLAKAESEPNQTGAPNSPDAPQDLLETSQGSFDLIRLDPQGKAVLAGSSNRRTTSLLMNDTLLENLEVSEAGQWSYVTDKPLPTGALTFALAVRDPVTGAFLEPYLAVAALFIDAPQAPGKQAEQDAKADPQIAKADSSPPSTSPSDTGPASANAEAASGEATPAPAPAQIPAPQASEQQTSEPQIAAATPEAAPSDDAGASPDPSKLADQLIAKADSLAEPLNPKANSELKTGEGGQMRLLAVSKSAGDTQFRVLSAQLSGPQRDGELFLERLDYDSFGNLVLTGQGQASQRVNLYVDNVLVGQPRVRRDQRWHLAPRGYQCEVGEHTLRADLVDDQGQVLSRVELPFERKATSWDTLGKVDLTIRRNDNLWTIASRAFGEGVKYTLIYENNNDQISDPNLIYPGQVFEIKREN